MENVKVFNQELSSLYETKPPVSRAKMAQLTKSAIKAIKFYKHVVQSVEKFVLKCRPEYKVPGLYVIDSIVRQSRHQFGLDKDVFAPRFTKNIVPTFQNLYKCPAEDKSKIVRVLNLWQKNGVFPSDVIQPLMDLAPDPTNADVIARAQSAVAEAVSNRESAKQPAVVSRSHEEEAPSQQKEAVDGLASQNDVLKTVTELLQQSQGVQSLSDQQAQLQQLQLLQQQLMLQTQILQQPDQQDQPMIDSNLLAQIQQLTHQLLNKTQEEEQQPTFNKKLLDFDYGESDEEDTNQSENVSGSQQDTLQGNVQNLLSNPGLINQIQQMSASIQKNEQLQGELNMQQQMDQPPFQQGPPQQQYASMGDGAQVEEGEIEDNNQSDMQEYDEMGERRDHRRRRSRSRSRSRRHRSRSRSRDRRRRSRSRDRHKRSKDRDRDRDRDRERERQREKERERRKLGLPPIKEKMISVCSNTIWIGHLNKQTTEEDIKGELEKYGDVNSIALIAPRGCAYASLAARKSASKALDRLKGAKLLGNTLKASWAMGTGLRESSFKENWDMDLGVSYIPWESLEDVQLDKLAEGATIDEESLPEHLRKEREQQQAAAEAAEMQATDANQQPPAQMPGIMGPGPGPGPGPTPGIVPGQPMPGMMPVLPGGMPPMMGMPPLGVPPPGLPGMVPGQMMAPPHRPLAPGLPGVPPGLPGVPTSLPAALLPSNQMTSGGETPTEAEPMLSKLQLPHPGSISGSSLQMAIQNIVNNSASITAVAQGTHAPGVRPLVQLTPGIRPALAPALTRLPPAFPQPTLPGQLPGNPAVVQQTNVNIPNSLVGMRLIGQPPKPLNLEENPILSNGPPVSLPESELNKEPNKGVRLPFVSMHQGGPPPRLAGQDTSPPRMGIRPDGPGGGLVRLDSPTMSNSPRPLAPMFNQRFPGPRGNPDGPPDTEADMEGLDGPVSLLDSQVRFHRPMGPRGMPMRGFPPSMPPRFGMRGMPMRPGFDRGPPPFAHERMDFRPFGRGGPRHRGDFRGRGRGFRGGRGGGPDRFRKRNMDDMDSDEMPLDQMNEEEEDKE